MCNKKAHTCYKGKETEECCNSRVREAVRNRTYLLALILGIALMIMALVIKTVDNTVFVNQISFASTITSIILSVIAIWMSITGERSTNEIKEKVSDSVEKLVGATNKSMGVADNLNSTLHMQNSKYDEIIQKLEEVTNNVEGMKTCVNTINDSLGEFWEGKKSNKLNLDSENLKRFVDNIISNFSNSEKGNVAKMLVKRGMNFVYDEHEKGNDFKPSDILHVIKEEHNSDIINGMILGIIMAFVQNGVFEKVNRKDLEL